MLQNFVQECYQKSIKLLLQNSSPYGLLASSPQKKALERNYLNIFARDTAISSLGMIASKNKKLIQLSRKSLQILAKHQALNGEIPNYVNPKNHYVDFWRLGSIDATLWWLIAINFYHQYANDKQFKKKLHSPIIKALNWLSAQEHNNDYLLRQTEASDWADLMPRSGKVLYTNALWYKVKTIYKLYAQKETAKNFNFLFYPFVRFAQKNIPTSDRATILAIKKQKNFGDFYISFANYLYWGEDIDVFGNSLALLTNLSSQHTAKKILRFINQQKKIAGFPVPATFRPIKENSKLWRTYMKSHKQNYPYQYHNGGTWPFVASFFAMAMHHTGQIKRAQKELEKIAQLNYANNWQFNEWFHTRTGQALGMHGQSWNAGAFLLAYHTLNGDVSF